MVDVQTQPTASIDNEIDPSGLGKIAHVDVAPSVVSYQNYPATSQNNNLITYRITVPSQQTYVNRYWHERIYFHVVGSGSVTAPITNMLQEAGTWGLRSYAGLRIKNTQSISLNSTSLPQTQCALIYPDIMLQYDPETRKYDSLSYPDCYQSFSDGLNASNNSLSTYDNSQPYYNSDMFPRGTNAISNFTSTPTSFTFDVVLDTFIYYPDLLGPRYVNEQGLIFLNDITINETLQLDPKYWFCQATGTHTTITSITANLTQTPTLGIKTITPPRELIPKEPVHYRHLHFDWWSYNSNQANIAPGSTVTITGNSVNLNQIPEYCFNWAHESVTNKTIYSTDTYMGMVNQQTTFNNNPNLNASASNYDLWMMSRQNGLTISYPNYNGTVTTAGNIQVGSTGGITCTKFGTNITLGTGNLSINQTGTFNFFVQSIFQNVNQSQVIQSPTMETIVAYVRDLTITNGGQVSIDAPLIPANFASGLGGAEKFEGLTVVPSFEQGAFGGNFSDFWKKVKNFLQKTRVISDVASAAAPALTALGVPPTLTDYATEAIRNSGYGAASMSKQNLRKALRAI